MIDQVRDEINQALASIQLSDNEHAVSNYHKSIISELSAKLHVIASETDVASLQRDVNVNISRHQKIIDKSLHPDVSKAYRITGTDPRRIVDQIIIGHLYHEGLFHVVNCLLKESGEIEVVSLRLQFEEFHQILNAVNCRNLEPALKWVSKNHGKIKDSGSNITLQLHKLKFADILMNGNRLDALRYARAYLSPFATNHMREIQKLMGSLLWAPKLHNSRYADLTAIIHWENLVRELVRAPCDLLGQPLRDPLKLSLADGFETLPTLLKLVNVMAATKQAWQAMHQLPVPLELGNEFQFHSHFVYPVSHDQASEENPPVMLPYGHVLCKNLAHKLSKAGSRNFKCPNCPVNASFADCKQLHF